MIEISDIFGLGKVGVKLIDFIQAGIGTAYEPINLIFMAKAKAKAIEIAAEAYRKNSDLSISYNDENYAIAQVSEEARFKRMQQRILYQETEKQQNIESIILLTAEMITDVQDFSKEPVDKKWAKRFFEGASEVDDEDTQKLWAKILAGEIEKKGSFSLRTLDILRNLSKEEAELFQKIAPYIIVQGNTTCILTIEIYNKGNFSVNDFLKLNEIGLVVSEIKSISFTESYFVLGNYSLLCKLPPFEEVVPHDPRSYKFAQRNKLELNAYPITSSGQELLKLFSFKFNEEFFIDSIKAINKNDHYAPILAVYRYKAGLRDKDYENEENILK